MPWGGDSVLLYDEIFICAVLYQHISLLSALLDFDPKNVVHWFILVKVLIDGLKE
jgi:hypothetical protein